MRLPWRSLLFSITKALAEGWQIGQMSVEHRSRTGRGGHEWFITISVGDTLGRPNAHIHLWRPRWSTMRTRRRCRLPCGAEARALNRISDLLARLGFTGGWTTRDGVGESAYFSKDVKDSEGMKEELRVLKGLRIGDTESRRS